MRVPSDLLWLLVGDIYDLLFVDDDRRIIEILWQIMADQGTELAQMLANIRQGRMVYLADDTIDWGLQYAEVKPSDLLTQLTMRLSGGNALNTWAWGGWSPKQGINITPPLSIRLGELASQAIVSSQELPLASGGSLWLLKTSDRSGGQQIQSTFADFSSIGYVFGELDDFSDGRWRKLIGTSEPSPTALGARFSLNSMEWTAIRDSHAINQLLPWSMTCVVSVDGWDIGSLAIAYIGLSAWTSDADGWGVRIEQLGSELSVVYGPSNTRVLFDVDLSSVSPSSPAQLELSLSWAPELGQYVGQVHVLGKTIKVTSEYGYSPSPANVIFDAFCETRSMGFTLLSVVDKGGQPLDFNQWPETRLGAINPWTYQCEQPLLSCERISCEPLDLRVSADVLSVGTTPSFRVDEVFEGYAPKYATLKGSELELIDVTDGVASYRVTQGGAPSVIVGEVVELAPWSLGADHITWLSPGTFSTSIKLPADVVWFHRSRGEGAALYENWGRALGLDREDDSLSYVHKIQGAWKLMHAIDTPLNIESGVARYLGAPLTKLGGVIQQITPKIDNQNRQIGFDCLIDRETVFISTSMAQDLEAVGQRLEPGQTLGGLVKAIDWRVDEDVVSSFAGPWGRFNAVVVSISDQLGINETQFNELTKLLKRSLDIHVRAYFDMATSALNENISTGEQFTALTHAYAHEDMVFPDHVSVVGNSITFNDEAQTFVDQELGDGVLTSQAYGLGPQGWVYEHSYEEPGFMMASPNLVHRAFFGRYLTRQLNGAVSTLETSKGFSRAPIRGADRPSARAIELWRAYDDDAEDLVTPSTRQWRQVTSTPAVTTSGVWIPQKDSIIIVGGSSARRSDDYGLTWSAMTVPGGHDLIFVRHGVAVGFSDSVSIQTGALTFAAAASTGLGDAGWRSAWSDGTNILLGGQEDTTSESILAFSDDGGATWTTDILSLSDVIYSVDRLDNGTYIASSTVSGLGLSDDGVTWAWHAPPGGSLRYVRALGDMIIGVYSDTVVMIDPANPTSWTDISDAGMSGQVLTAVATWGGYGIVILSESDLTAWRSTDSGQTWSEESCAAALSTPSQVDALDLNNQAVVAETTSLYHWR